LGIHVIDQEPQTTQPLQVNDGVIALDRASRVMGFNQSFLNLLGIKIQPGDFLELEDIFEGPELASAQAALDQALGGKPISGVQGHVRDSGGQRFLCEYSILPMYGASRQITGVMLTIHDLEFSCFGQGGLDAGETLPHLPKLGFQTLFENLAEGIFTINTRWRITSFNQTAEQITGYQREEVLGRFCWDIFHSDLCESGCPLRTTLETGVTRMDQDVRMLSKEGRRISVLTNTSVVRDRSGSVVGAVESFRALSGLEQNHGEAGPAGHEYANIVGQSPQMKRLFSMLTDVAASEASVLITGESGTGKELFARAIHNKSPRKEGPFIAVNCSALAESLLESEIFGHEKAAFTGAVRSKVGRFELAKGGTLFLDEIGDLKPELQIKLLRVLEERMFERVGGTRLLQLDARIIAATNRDLTKALQEGAFREDLYYRLRTVPLVIPPLRERDSDIPLLVSYFIKRLNQSTGKDVRAVDPKVMKRFMAYDWPGNVRELERVMEYAFVFVKGPVIFPSHLPSMNAEADKEELSPSTSSGVSPASDEERLRQEVVSALNKCGGRRGDAAQLLGISRTSLWRRMKALSLA
jgi:PAS domain S-box-containing protein